MTRIRFEWDERKNLANQRKHGVTFEEATQIFYDPLQVSAPDSIEDDEQRWQTIGLVDGVLLMMAAHTVHEECINEEVIRIISARYATPKERRLYEIKNG